MRKCAVDGLRWNLESLCHLSSPKWPFSAITTSPWHIRDMVIELLMWKLSCSSGLNIDVMIWVHIFWFRYVTIQLLLLPFPRIVPNLVAISMISWSTWWWDFILLCCLLLSAGRQQCLPSNLNHKFLQSLSDDSRGKREAISYACQNIWVHPL